MSYNLHYNILNTKTVLRKDTILKRITNTLLIATLFTSSIIASQGCTGSTCMATFGKKADTKVIATNISFKPNKYVVTKSIPSFIQEEVSSTEESSLTEKSSTTDRENIELVLNEEETTPPFEPTIISEEIIEPIEYLENNIDMNIKIATVLENDTVLQAKPYCEEEQEVLSCDITAEDTSECVCA